jgi:DNA-binding MarR family transcriptional regulator
MLHWLAADWRRTNGGTSSSHWELLRALRGDKSNMSHSLRTLEARGLMVIERSSGGKAESVVLTAEGQKLAFQVE